MNVLHCITGLSGDGAQRMLLRLTESMRHLGVRSSVVSLEADKGVSRFFEEAGVRVWSLNIKPTALGAALGVKRLGSIIRATRPDIIQGWMYHANVMALSAKLLTPGRAAIMWNIRRGLDDYAERRLKTRCVVRSNAIASKMVDGIIYCSSVSKSQHEQMGFHASHSTVLENGFDTTKFRPRPEARRSFRHQYGISDEEIVIGNIGRFDIAKGHMYLLKAFQIVLSTQPKARLVLIGRGVDESNLELVAALDRYSCRERVLLLGEQDAVENLHPGFDIYCSSSISEGFPNALSEAMACGTACVATDTGASAQLVKGIGRVVPPRCAQQLAEALVAAIDDGPALREAAGGYGRERILNEYALSSVARQYYNLYSRAIAALRP
jgi:glycosyltransferase involved in cell wall biosynthesis